MWLFGAGSCVNRRASPSSSHVSCSSPSTLDAFELIAAVDFKENLIMITAQEDGMVHHVVDVHLQPGMYTQSRRNSSLETSASWRFNLR